MSAAGAIIRSGPSAASTITSITSAASASSPSANRSAISASCLTANGVRGSFANETRIGSAFSSSR